jgi:hypothetical protein
MGTVRVPLTHDKYAFIDEEDAERVSEHSWTYLWSPNWPNRAYAQTGIKKRAVLLHRFILGVASDEDVDHINRNGLDNRKCNLRPCDQTHNNANSRKRVTTKGYRGVQAVASGYRARIQHGGIVYRSEAYPSERQAAEAYDVLAREIFGEFAYQNLSDAPVIVPPIEHPDDLPIITKPSLGGVHIGPSGYRGVKYSKNERLWSAAFTPGGKRRFLGYYRTAEDAARVYDEYVYQILGDAAVLNLPCDLGKPIPARILLSRRNTSGFRGVSERNGGRSWEARIVSGGRYIHLGTFSVKEDAARAHDRKARELHGSKARLNFPDEV